MFMFLYLFGPGCLSFALRSMIFGREKRANLLNAIVEILTYSLIDMAMTIVLLNPFNKVKIDWDQSYIPVVKYGSVAVVFGILSSIAIVFAEKLYREIREGNIEVKLLIEKRIKYTSAKRKNSRWLAYLIAALIVIVICILGYRVLQNNLPEDENLIPAPTLSLVEPVQIMSATRFSESDQIKVEGQNLTNVTDVLINGEYDSACTFTITEKTNDSGDTDLNKSTGQQIMNITLPTGYYGSAGYISVQVQSLDRNTGKFLRSNSVDVEVLPTDQLTVPVIREVIPKTLDTSNICQQWVTLKGDGFDDAYVIVNGAEKEAIYDADTNTLKFKLDYSEWCLLDNVFVSVGRKYNGYNTPVKSKQYSLDVKKTDVACDFDNSWTREHYVAHAMGSIDNIDYTNCFEAFERNYELGHRVFEVDICTTADGQLILKHDWTLGNYDIENYDTFAMNNLAKDWKDISANADYTLLTFDELLTLMEKYPDMYIITDTKDNNSVAIESTFNSIAQIIRKHNKSVKNRIIVQIYNEPMFYEVMHIYPFNSVIYNLYQSDARDAEVIDFVKEAGISAIACGEERLSDSLTAELERFGCPVYVYTIDDAKKVSKYASRGVYGFYSNDLGPFNCYVDIDSLRKGYFASDLTYLNEYEDDAVTKENYETLKYYLRQLNNDYYIVALAVNGDASKNMTEELRDILKKYGIAESSLCDTGYSFVAILNRKQCLCQQYANSKLTENRWVDGVHVVVNSCGSSVEGEQPVASIKIDGVENSVNQQGLNIVVYNKNLGKVVDSICFNLHDGYQKTNANIN